MQFTNQELQSLITLIKRVHITGEEAIGVVLLQQKIGKLLQPEVKTEPEKKK